jgi:peptidoglycan/LPS O-acetylase OafA/YrhL
MQDVYSQYKINNVFWSIAVEWKIYFLFPLLLWSWRKIGPWKTTGIVLVLSNIACRLTQHTRWEGLWLNYIGLFAMGMLAAEICMTQLDLRAEKILASGWLLAMVTLLVGGWLRFVGIWPDGSVWWKTWPALDFPIAVLVVIALVRMASVERSTLRKILSLRPLAALGTITYSLYLIHGPMIEIVWKWVCHPLHLGRMGTFVVLIAATPLVILGAYLFFKIAEEPFLRKKPKTPRADEPKILRVIPVDQSVVNAPPGKISVEKVDPVEKVNPSVGIENAEGISLS